jgi:hypothetical protein
MPRHTALGMVGSPHIRGDAPSVTSSDPCNHATCHPNLPFLCIFIEHALFPTLHHPYGPQRQDSRYKKREKRSPPHCMSHTPTGNAPAGNASSASAKPSLAGVRIKQKKRQAQASAKFDPEGEYYSSEMLQLVDAEHSVRSRSEML